jgi:quinol monooxygenase YgiN
VDGLGLVVRFLLRRGHEQQFDDLVSATLAGIRDEPGTLLYVSHAVIGQPRVRVFYELYRDRAAFDTHEQQDHVRTFLSEREAHVESFTVDFVRPLDGTPLDGTGLDRTGTAAADRDGASGPDRAGPPRR